MTMGSLEEDKEVREEIGEEHNESWNTVQIYISTCYLDWESNIFTECALIIESIAPMFRLLLTVPKFSVTISLLIRLVLYHNTNNHLSITM